MKEFMFTSGRYSSALLCYSFQSDCPSRAGRQNGRNDKNRRFGALQSSGLGPQSEQARATSAGLAIFRMAGLVTLSRINRHSQARHALKQGTHFDVSRAELNEAGTQPIAQRNALRGPQQQPYRNYTRESRLP